MRGANPRRLEKLVDELEPLFYGLMGVSLLAIFVGALGPGALLLILGSAVQVVRAACEGLAARQRNRARRVRPVVVRPRREPLYRATESRRPARQVAASGSSR